MSEVLPRWNLPEVNFLETDPEKIKSEIITGYEKASGSTLAAGDPRRLFLLTIASDIIQLRNLVNYAAQQNLLSYATGDHLDALGLYLSVTRLPATKASAIFKFTLSERLSNAYVITKGTEITNGTVTFATIEDAVIEPDQLSVEVRCECTIAGVAGNGFLAGQIATLVVPQTFIASVENINETQGGSDVEEDPAYAERIRLKPNSFSVAGPVEAYRYFALSVTPAVVDVQIHSPTPGVVNIYPLLADGAIPEEAVLKQIEDFVSGDTLRPLTDEVHVLAPSQENYEIFVDYWVNDEDSRNLEAIQNTVKENVETYRIWQQSKIGRDITPSELIAKVKDAGASKIDLSTLKPNQYQVLGESKVAHCTSVSINFKGMKEP